MNWQIIFRIQGFLLIVLALMMLFPLAFSIYYQGNDTTAIALSAAITMAAGVLLNTICRKKNRVRAKEGFLIVTLGWVFAAGFGALPFFLHGSFGSYINCVFEAMSGFTTTGATILTNIEVIPKGLLFWRSLTHWLGGMGIILLAIAILPILGLNSKSLYNAEVPGPTKERISPKIKDTAKFLWYIYCALTVLETVLLMFGGMNLYNALCHTFGTLATGGFSTLNSSIAGFKSVYIEVIIIIFMYLAGINFALHFQIVTGKPGRLFKDSEWRFYTAILLLSTLFIAWNIHVADYSKEMVTKFPRLATYGDNFFNALRDSAFQVASITTTTGYCTANFNVWPQFSRILLIILMFFGGCAGSTGGGMKQIRVLMLFKHVFNEIKRLAHPNGVFTVRIGKKGTDDYVIRNVLGFFVLFILFFAGVTLFLAARGYDTTTAFSASIATLGNIGPGLAKVGAIENYAFFDPVSKVVLSFAMLLGRLEIYSVLILVYAIFARRR